MLQTLHETVDQAMRNSGYTVKFDDVEFHSLSDVGNVVVKVYFMSEDNEGVEFVDEGFVYLKFKDSKWYGEF